MHLLHVEDSDIYARLIREELSDFKQGARITRVASLAQAIRTLEDTSGITLVLLDLSLPDSAGINTLMSLLPHCATTPVIVLSGAGEQALGLEAVRCGAQDYLMKDDCNGQLLAKSLDFALERHRAKQASLVTAMTDALTGLPNRSYFNDHLRAALAKAGRSNTPLVLLYIDFDGFKQLNDTYGHHEGDHFLSEIGSRFKNTLRKADFCARLGGDEFAIVIDSPHREIAGIERFLDNLLTQMRVPFRLTSGNRVASYCSIGVAMFDPQVVPDKSAETLMREADQAMYRAKQEGGNCYRSHHSVESVNPPPPARDSRVHDTPGNNAFTKRYFLEYQLIFNGTTGEPSGASGLLRLKNRPSRAVAPAEVINDIAGAEVGRWLFEDILDNFRSATQVAGRDDIFLTLALGTALLEDPEFIEILSTQPNDSGHKGRFVFELPLADLGREHIRHSAERLQQLGYSIAIAGVGDGPVDLRALLTLPGDLIKLGPALTDAATSDSNAAKTIEVLTALAQHGGKSVLAEGVNSRVIYDRLRQGRVNYLQGDYCTAQL